MKKFSEKVKLWRWPGDGGWHFVTLDKKLFDKIRAKYGKGMLRINAQIGKTKFETSLLPHNQSLSYLIAIKKSVRYDEDIFDGDEFIIKFEIK